MKKTLAIIVSVLMISQSQAGMRQYGAPLSQSKWQVTENSRLSCTLSHQIPNYGHAVFRSAASRDNKLSF